MFCDLIGDNTMPSIVPVEVFENGILKKIEEKTEKKLNAEDLNKMDIGDIERMLELTAREPIKIGRNYHSSLYKFRDPETAMWDRAVVSRFLEGIKPS